MYVSVPIFVEKIKSVHPELTEQDLFVEGKELTCKGFALLLAHFSSSNTRTHKPSRLTKDITTSELILTKRILQNTSYVSMFFIKDGTIFVTGPFLEVAKLSNQSYENFIAQLAVFDNFNVALIDNLSLAQQHYDKLLYVVPSDSKPYASYMSGMAKRKARAMGSYVLIVNPETCETLEKPTYDKKLTDCGRLLASNITNSIIDDAPKGLYCRFTLDDESALSISQQREIVETMMDEILVDYKQLKGKVTLRMSMGLWYNYEVLIQYTKKGKQIIKEDTNEVSCKS